MIVYKLLTHFIESLHCKDRKQICFSSRVLASTMKITIALSNFIVTDPIYLITYLADEVNGQLDAR